MPLQNNQQLIYNSTLSKWTNDFSSLSDQKDVLLSTPSNGQVLSYNGTKWINNTTSSGSPTMSTDTTTTTLNLSSYSTNTYIDYTASSITVSNGPYDISNPIYGGVAVKFETDGVFFTQTLYVNSSTYVRSGKLSSINTSQWISSIISTTSTNNFSVIDGLTTPPIGVFIDGDTYYILPSPTGLWSSFTAGNLAVYNDSTSTWSQVVMTNSNIILLTNPVNLSNLSSTYYYSGVTTVYNTTFTPVVTGVFLQVLTTSVTLPSNIKNLTFKKIIPLLDHTTAIRTYATNYLASEAGAFMGIDIYNRLWSRSKTNATTSYDYYNFGGNGIIGSRFLMRTFNDTPLVTVSQACGAGSYSLVLRTDKKLVAYMDGLAQTATQVGGDSTAFSVTTISQAFNTADSAVLDSNVNVMYNPTDSSNFVNTYLLGVGIAYPSISTYYTKTSGKTRYFGCGAYAAFDSTISSKKLTTITLGCDYTVGSNIVTINTASINGNSQLDYDLNINVIAGVVPAGTLIGTLINGNQFTMVNSSGVAVNALSTISNQSTVFNILGVVVGVRPYVCSITTGTTTLTVPAGMGTLFACLGYVYHPTFPNGRTKILSSLSSNTVQLQNAATSTLSSVSLNIDILTSNIQKFFFSRYGNLFVLIVTTNNNILVCNPNFTTLTNYTSFFPNFTSINAISIGLGLGTTASNYGVWYKTTGNVDAIAVWGTTYSAGNGVGSIFNTFSAIGTVDPSNPTNILVSRTLTTAAVSSGLSTITTSAPLTGPFGTGYYITGSGIPANTYVGDILTPTTFKIVDVDGNSVVTNAAMSSGNVLTFTMLGPGESIVNYRNRPQTAGGQQADCKCILTSNNRMFFIGALSGSMIFCAPTLASRNVTGIYFDAFLGCLHFLYLKTDGWLYMFYSGSAGGGNNICPPQIPNTADTFIKTIYSTAQYGNIVDVVSGYVLTTTGKVIALQAGRAIELENSSIVSS